MSAEPTQQYCPLDHENRSNAYLRASQPLVRSRFQPDAIASATRQGPPALQRTPRAQPLKSRGEEHPAPVQRSCEDQKSAELHHHIGKPQPDCHALSLPIQRVVIKPLRSGQIRRIQNRLKDSAWLHCNNSRIAPPNDPSSATAATRGGDCNRSAMPPFAAAHGWAAFSWPGV